MQVPNISVGTAPAVTEEGSGSLTRFSVSDTTASSDKTVLEETRGGRYTFLYMKISFLSVFNNLKEYF